MKYALPAVKQWLMATIIAVIAQGAVAQPLPVGVRALAPTLTEVGTGTLHKLGFRIYDATLWAAAGRFHADQPFALQLHYHRALSKDTLIDAVMTAIREQKSRDSLQLARWEAELRRTLPEIEEGDEIVGISVPGKPAVLVYNGHQIATLDDHAFREAFFGIWLGDYGEDNPLRDALLGRSS